MVSKLESCLGKDRQLMGKSSSVIMIYVFKASKYGCSVKMGREYVTGK